SLGAATLIGATAGGLWQGVEHWGKRISGKLKGYRELSVDDPVIRLLAARQLALVKALEQRGHAAQSPIQIEGEQSDDHAEKHPLSADTLLPAELRKGSLPDALQGARVQPDWCSMPPDPAPDSRREQAMRAIAALLQSAL